MFRGLEWIQLTITVLFTFFDAFKSDFSPSEQILSILDDDVELKEKVRALEYFEQEIEKSELIGQRNLTDLKLLMIELIQKENNQRDKEILERFYEIQNIEERDYRRALLAALKDYLKAKYLQVLFE